MIGLLAFGMLSGLLGSAMVLVNGGSFGLALLAYSVVGSLAVLLYAAALAARARTGETEAEQ
jgi:hypothetical protein